MRKIAYLRMDVHAKHCFMGNMDVRGNFNFTMILNKIIARLEGKLRKN